MKYTKKRAFALFRMIITKITYTSIIIEGRYVLFIDPMAKYIMSYTTRVHALSCKPRRSANRACWAIAILFLVRDWSAIRRGELMQMEGGSMTLFFILTLGEDHKYL